MPVSAVNVLPRGIGKMLRKRGLALGLADKLSDFRAARYPTMFAAFGLSLLVYLHAKSLFGRLPGLFAQLLFVISPNITAHSTLATTDLYIALATALFLYCFRRFLQHPSTPNAALTASDRKSTRLNSSHQIISYTVFCFNKKAIHTFLTYMRP